MRPSRLPAAAGRRRLLAISLFAGATSLASGSPASACEAIHECYSDVHAVDAAGGVVGYELELSIHGTEVSGTLRVFDGAAPVETWLEGSARKRAVEVSGRLPSGSAIRIRGARSGAAFVGEARFDSGGAVTTHGLDLKAKRDCE